MSEGRYQVRRVGGGHVVIDPDGKQVRGPYRGNDEAQEVCDVMQRRHDRQQMRKRPCMCCRREFISEGAHHRLCDECRRSGDGLPNQYSNSATLTLPRSRRQA